MLGNGQHIFMWDLNPLNLNFGMAGLLKSEGPDLGILPILCLEKWKKMEGGITAWVWSV